MILKFTDYFPLLSKQDIFSAIVAECNFPFAKTTG